MAAVNAPTPPNISDEQDDSRSSSSTTSPVPADNEESDFFLGANDSQSSLGVHNFQDMQVDDACWPPVNRLPNEILISIFSRLVGHDGHGDLFNCLMVSKRWARNAVDLLWHRPALVSVDNLESICRTLTSSTPYFSYKDFIKRLNLAVLHDKINNGSVFPLATCSRIERLTLTNCRSLSDNGLIALVQNSALLLALDITQCELITDASIYKIAEHCRRLQGLNISGCEQVHNDSMIAVAENCRFIKRLKLNECQQLTDTAIHAFAQNCPNMLEIDLQQCSRIGNGPVTALLSKGNCLRELRLANCDLITDSAFTSLPPNQTYEHLRILDLTSCHQLTDAAVIKIIDSAPRLRNLVLAKCRNITDNAVVAIAKLGKNLHYVHLGHCGLITDEGVKRLVGSCNRIRYIDLGCCINLTDDSVRRLALLPKLKRIGLVKCGSITDDSVIALANAAHRPRIRRDASGGYEEEYFASSLERVHLSYCVNLTLQSIMKLLNSCPRLTHLSLTGVAAFQRDDFQPFCRQAPPEFTQHQRDVFCVFSGNMVKEFRRFLNESPLFEEMRGGRRHVESHHSRGETPAFNGEGMGGGGDFDNGDDNDDFEAFDGSDMIIDAQTQNPWYNLNTHQQPHQGQHMYPPPPPPPPPVHGSLPLANDVGPLQFSSFLSSQPAQGQPPLSAHGHASLASYASGSASVQQASMAGGNPGAGTGASTATAHRPQPSPTPTPPDLPDGVD